MIKALNAISVLFQAEKNGSKPLTFKCKGKLFFSVLMLKLNNTTSSICVSSFIVNVQKWCMNVIMHTVYEWITSHMAEIKQQLLGDVQAFSREWRSAE